jgi:hypothetical protein
MLTAQGARRMAQEKNKQTAVFSLHRMQAGSLPIYLNQKN